MNSRIFFIKNKEVAAALQSFRHRGGLPKASEPTPRSQGFLQRGETLCKRFLRSFCSKCSCGPHSLLFEKDVQQPRGTACVGPVLKQLSTAE